MACRHEPRISVVLDDTNQTVFQSGSSDQGVFADCLATAHGRSYGQSVRAARAQASLNQLCGIQQSLAQGGKPDDCHG
ncbi:hypothetical protein D9M70_285960 [compost metagenome]